MYYLCAQLVLVIAVSHNIINSEAFVDGVTCYIGNQRDSNGMMRWVLSKQHSQCDQILPAGIKNGNINEADVRTLDEPLFTRNSQVATKFIQKLGTPTPSCHVPNMVYMACTPNCNKSCENPNGVIGCSNSCTLPGGCVCPDGFLWKENDCILPDNCGCFVSSEIGVLTEATIHINNNCTARCVCNRTGKFTCNNGYQCDDNAICDVREGNRQCYCNDGFVGDGEDCTPVDCSQILLDGNTQSGIYTIQPMKLQFEVYCNMTIDGGGWTVFQRRINGDTGFYRSWKEYKNGFGDLDTEFWLGNEKLFNLTNQRDYEIRIDFVNTLLDPYYAHYTIFRVSDETMNYQLIELGNFSGTANYDAMRWNERMNFSTYDHDRDNYDDNCAVHMTGAWWYNTCYNSNLNGDYNGSVISSIRWSWLPGNQYNLRFTEMKIRSL